MNDSSTTIDNPIQSSRCARRGGAHQRCARGPRLFGLLALIIGAGFIGAWIF